MWKLILITRACEDCTEEITTAKKKKNEKNEKVGLTSIHVLP